MDSSTKDTAGEASSPPNAHSMPSEDLAAIVIDALIRAGIVQQSDVERALKIATEEIEVRKALGDY